MRATQTRKILRLHRAWKRKHRDNPASFVAGVVYGLRCAVTPDEHLRHMGINPDTLRTVGKAGE